MPHFCRVLTVDAAEDYNKPARAALQNESTNPLITFRKLNLIAKKREALKNLVFFRNISQISGVKLLISAFHGLMAE